MHRACEINGPVDDFKLQTQRRRKHLILFLMIKKFGIVSSLIVEYDDNGLSWSLAHVLEMLSLTGH